MAVANVEVAHFSVGEREQTTRARFESGRVIRLHVIVNTQETLRSRVVAQFTAEDRQIRQRSVLAYVARQAVHVPIREGQIANMAANTAVKMLVHQSGFSAWHIEGVPS